MAENNTLNVEKALKQLKSSYDMYEKTKKDTEARMKTILNSDGTKRYSAEDIKKEIDTISVAEQDVIDQYLQLGGKEEDLKKKSAPRKKIKEESVAEKVLEMIGENRDKMDAIYKSISETSTQIVERLPQDYIPTKGDYNSEMAFDVIPLPSKGEGYRDKISKASVAYLNAYDENMIVSPNLYRDNLILDYLLEEKLLSKEIDPMDLLEGDRDAIILFLRASGYGNEYPITATDNVTGKEFDTIIDLSKLKYKEFNLKGDSNGWFSYVLPVSGKEIKFRFPTHRDTVLLKRMQDAEDANTKKETIKNYVEMLDTFIESDTEVTKDDKIKIRQSIRNIENWGDRMDDETAVKYNHNLTNRLNLLIMAVDGITDKTYINNFIKKMNVRDSSSLRKYILANEPGVDYTITVERPESLGGGSFDTFLQLDQFLFLNIAE